MGLPDLTGLNIEDTYERILQTDGIFIYDGTGSIVNISNSINTGSFAVTGSNVFIGNQIITGSVETTNAITAPYFVGIIDGGVF
jgi:hypothetical protein